ncbi:MAG: hypothetical protein IT343_25065, partial [Candidatus Melainabacteria bacterium]|nr:hypothetical protein [Candidatus Melainabacteria bacterium]
MQVKVIESAPTKKEARAASSSALEIILSNGKIIRLRDECKPELLKTVISILEGTKTTGNILTVTVYDAALAGGVRTVNYTVLAGDTLTTMATNLAAAINA